MVQQISAQFDLNLPYLASAVALKIRTRSPKSHQVLKVHYAPMLYPCQFDSNPLTCS